MKAAVMLAGVFALAAAPAWAQTYPAYAGQGARVAAPSGGTSVAYGQPVYYVQRLRASRHYPPNLYGYFEGGRVSGLFRTPSR